jgi:hypothetical protein
MIANRFLMAQDIEKVMKADSVAKGFFQKLMTTEAVSLSGNFSARLLYEPTLKTRRNYTYLLNGNLDVDLFGYSVPLSFTYSNRGADYDYSLPISFNRFRFNPHYKWVKLYLGQSSLSFSPYTLSGMQFSGIGLELTPKGPFKISAMYGTLYKPVEADSIKMLVKPVYKRNGAAIMAEYQRKTFQFKFSMLESSDMPNSINMENAMNIGIAPLQNVAYCLESKLMPLDAVVFDIRYASSAVNKMLYNQRRSFTEMLYGEHDGVSRYSAYKLGVDFSPGIFTTGFSFEHIDPGYKTLGAYYSKNNFQNATLKLGGNFFDGKLNLAANGGIENSEMNDVNDNENIRMIGSVNLSSRINDDLNLNASYSNFQTYVNIKNQFDYINQTNPMENLDTLNYSQVSQNATMGVSYVLKNTEEERQMARLSANYNQAVNDQNGEVSTSRFYNLNANWSLALPKKNTMINVGTYSSFSEMPMVSSVTLGPSMSVNNVLFDKKVRMSNRITMNWSYLNGERQNANYNFSNSMNYKYNDMHSFLFSLSYFLKNVKGENNHKLSLSFTYRLTIKKRNVVKAVKQ